MKTGIWIDTKMAVIVFLDANTPVIKKIHSEIVSRERIPGETKWYTRLGNQFINFETKKQHRKAKEIKDYLKKVAVEIRDTTELVLFGPAFMKTALEKLIREDVTLSAIIRGVETSDSMTDNQVVAWVKNYYTH